MPKHFLPIRVPVAYLLRSSIRNEANGSEEILSVHIPYRPEPIETNTLEKKRKTFASDQSAADFHSVPWLLLPLSETNNCWRLLSAAFDAIATDLCKMHDYIVTLSFRMTLQFSVNPLSQTTSPFFRWLVFFSPFFLAWVHFQFIWYVHTQWTNRKSMNNPNSHITHMHTHA